MSESLEVKREGRLLRVTLNRPEKRNALNLVLCRELVSTLQEAGEDDSVGAVLLDAQGTAFCAGMDLEEAIEAQSAEPMRIHEKLFTIGSEYSKPIVAAVQGPALAGGTGLVANAHVVVAAQGATFGLTEIRIAMWPYVVYRSVVRAVGERLALELSLTGRIFSTTEALQYGLIHQVVPAFELDDRAEALGQTLANRSPHAMANGMEFVRRTRELPPAEAGQLALEFREQMFRDPDFQEGVRAFQEKRKADWPSLREK